MRAMPTSSHMMRPSSRWISRMPRLPLTDSSWLIRCCTLSAASLNASWSVVTFGQRRARQVVADRVRDDEVAVGQPLHQRAGAQPVGAVIGEVRFAQHVQARQVAHQVVVDPEPAHRVVDGRVDPHRHLVRILVGDLLVHVEEVAVLLLDRLGAEPLDRVGEVEIHRQAALADAAALVADLLGVARRDVARHEVAEARILALEVVVALRLRESAPAAACRPAVFGTQTRPSLRRLSLISVSFDWCSPRHRNAGRDGSA